MSAAGGGVEGRCPIRLRVNGEEHELLVAVSKTLLEVLREDLRLTGTKHGCELGECGTCTVLVDGQPLLSCLLLPIEFEGREIETVEALARPEAPHPLQETFAELGAAQCGYCTPGMLMSAKALLDELPRPSREQIREGLAGNLCRCTGYLQILEAVEAAAERLAASGGTAAEMRDVRGDVVAAAGPATATPAAAAVPAPRGGSS